MKYNDIKEEKKSGGTVVQSSKPVSLSIEGGTITGKFCGTQKRESENGEYILHIIEGKGIGLDKQSGKPVALEAGRYGVFGVTRLDRLMREIMKGDNVTITYQGKEANEKTETNPEGEGIHHKYEVVLLD